MTLTTNPFPPSLTLDFIKNADWYIRAIGIKGWNGEWTNVVSLASSCICGEHWS